MSKMLFDCCIDDDGECPWIGAILCSLSDPTDTARYGKRDEGERLAVAAATRESGCVRGGFDLM